MKYFSILFVLLSACCWPNLSWSESRPLMTRQLTYGELPAHTLSPFPNSVQTMYLQIDFSELDQLSEWELPLFNQESIRFRFNRQFHYSVGSSSWYGKETDGAGDVIFSFFQQHISGIIVDRHFRKYILQQINSSDLFALTLVQNEGMQESPAGIPDYVERQPLRKKTRLNADVCAAGTNCGTASTIDLMVLGTAAAITNGGGTVASFTTNVTSAVTEMNTAYANSGGTDLTFNLIHCDATAFTTTGDLFNDLNSFESNAGVQALRNTHFADLVGLWAGSGSYSGFCGVGNLNTNPVNYNADAAYTITDYGCGMTNLTYAHECGHNMGLRHDYYVDNGTTPCSHHHGYVNQAVIPTGLPNTARWRTIMAYNNQCSDNGFNCTRLARWSNPNLNYLGSPTGVAIGSPQPSFEMYGFERMRCVVSSFRSNPLPVTMLSFHGEVKGQSAILQWKTASENNNKGFDIEFRKANQEDFQSVGFVEGKHTSSMVNEYTFQVDQLTAGYYDVRLKQWDLDQQFTYSPVIRLLVSSDKLQSGLYPNPAKGNLLLSMHNPEKQVVTVTLHDMLGNSLRTLWDGVLEQGTTDRNITLAGLPAGNYFAVIRSRNEKQVIKLSIE